MIGLWLETNRFMGTCSFMKKKNMSWWFCAVKWKLDNFKFSIFTWILVILKKNQQLSFNKYNVILLIKVIIWILPKSFLWLLLHFWIFWIGIFCSMCIILFHCVIFRWLLCLWTSCGQHLFCSYVSYRGLATETSWTVWENE